ncbi:DUF4407 domain-containing protein [Pseudonocardia sp. KRD-184]|uniref:DUF4407 domain-containing protein n=1 Tax=Pseudonocardia oceani TaxID=2792013 RepID=A0ABS6U9C5_9PSEU|nr:DUF4407 domain-containing protein [Pseudonocardia oceani]MBW0088484.1 DUF4407 domain-containing protein [Pseudonocardia oceani]MBW0095374.1 DUF4407 domain-containing protein [Pseudonocardia oceani]MBW0121805.1 DUF4407 domain-containing protein [Pseudonocardia oceani]MBW0128474.1 DUF4407 domain-containing protein [Pseudonocardia oceani]
MAWLGGGDWREIEDRTERSTFQMSGFFVVLNALIAGVTMGLAITGAVRTSAWAALPAIVLWALFVGTFDRAISTKIDDPEQPRWRRTGGYLVRGLFTIVIGVIVAEAAGLTIFASSIERTLADNVQAQITSSQQLVTGELGTPSSRQRELDELIARRQGLDESVQTAQETLDTANDQAACERNPGPGCANVTGVPGDGPQTRARDAQADQAREALSAATDQRAALADGLDQEIAAKRILLAADAAMVERLARSENGIDARWRAMHDYTTSSDAALALRLLLAVGLIFLDLVPLLLKMLRGRAGHDRRILAARHRNANALQAHTGRYHARLDHESTEHQADLDELAEAGAIARRTRTENLDSAAQVDRGIERARQESRLAEALAEIEVRGSAGGVGGRLPAPRPTLSIPVWWTAADEKLIGKRFGVYEAIGALEGADRSAFGRILVGRNVDNHSDKAVIKVVAEESDGAARKTATRKMWDAEVAAARKLQSHTAIAEVLGYGHTHGYLWIASRLYAPGSLVRWVESSGQGLSLIDTVMVMRQVIEALRYAHSQRLAHGDLKPHNIVLEGIRVRLVDWGLARAVGSVRGEISTGRPQGTKFYSPPEAFLLGHSGDQYGDLYSIGATWYFLLAGCAPFSDLPDLPHDIVAFAHRAQAGSLVPTPLLNLLPGLPPDLASLIHRLLAGQPTDRAPMDPKTTAVSALAEKLLDIERRLTPAQRNLPVGAKGVQEAQGPQLVHIEVPIPRPAEPTRADKPSAPDRNLALTLPDPAEHPSP